MINDNVTGIVPPIFSQLRGPGTDEISRAACRPRRQPLRPAPARSDLGPIPSLLTGEAYRRLADAACCPCGSSLHQSEAEPATAIGPPMKKCASFLLRLPPRQAIAACRSTLRR